MELWRQELYASSYSQEYLAHHGIKGQRWGVRRFQNPDGTLTPEGKERYRKNAVKSLLKDEEYRDETLKAIEVGKKLLQQNKQVSLYDDEGYKLMLRQEGNQILDILDKKVQNLDKNKEFMKSAQQLIQGLDKEQAKRELSILFHRGISPELYQRADQYVALGGGSGPNNSYEHGYALKEMTIMDAPGKHYFPYDTYTEKMLNEKLDEIIDGFKKGA